MHYVESRPSPLLSPFVKCFWALDYQNKGPVLPEPVIPDGCVEIIFNLSDRFQRYRANGEIETQSSSLIAGQMHRSVLIGPSGDVDLFGIRFKPAGAFRFLRFDLKDIADRIDPLEAVLGNSVASIEEQLFECSDFRSRVAVAESFLTGSMRSTSSRRSSEVDHAIEIISGESGTVSIREIAKKIRISERGLERLFRRYVGTTPKAYSRIVRFQRVLKAIERNGQQNILDTALAFGYYDQSHLINDFNQFSGSSPSTFLERSRQMTDIFVSGD